jgi:hypothetical protein
MRVCGVKLCMFDKGVNQPVCVCFVKRVCVCLLKKKRIMTGLCYVCVCDCLKKIFIYI